MFGDKPICIECGKEIEGGEKVHIEMIYPKRKGMTEIKAYLELEGKMTCRGCYWKEIKGKNQK